MLKLHNIPIHISIDLSIDYFNKKIILKTYYNTINNFL